MFRPYKGLLVLFSLIPRNDFILIEYLIHKAKLHHIDPPGIHQSTANKAINSLLLAFLTFSLSFE